MRRFFVAALLVLLPFTGMAQTAQSTESSGYNLRNIVLLSAGVVAGVLIVDYIFGSALTVPAASVMTPAIEEAGAAGAVFGDQVAAATAARDAKARADVVYGLLLGTGAIFGGWIFNQIGSLVSSEPPAPIQ